MTDETEKIDRRVLRTRRQLREALTELILERGYHAVTVEDITERADLGRTTFYLHFHDKDELLISSLETISDELRLQLEQLADDNQETGASMDPVALVFRHVEENRSLYRILFKGEGNRIAGRIRASLQASALALLTRRINRYTGISPEMPIEVVAGCFASALMGYLAWWLEEEVPPGRDEAAEIFMKLFFRGAIRILNLTDKV